MNSFLASAACRGRRPRAYLKVRLAPRPTLISRLMAERQVARFLVAPPGYGKSCLALEYAQTVFGLSHVFWVDCQSPCFLRDLDKGTLAEDLFALDSAAALVVLASVPRMGSARADELSRCMDLWLDNGCEVLALTVPSCDAFSRRQHDRICLYGEDLLLSEDEKGEVAGGGGLAPVPESESCFGADSGFGVEDGFDTEAGFDACSIPCFAWGGEDAWGPFLHKAAREPLPLDLRLLFFLVLLFGRVSAERLRGFTRMGSFEGLGQVFARYPHLGYREEAAAFAGLDAPMAEVAAAFRPLLPSLAEASRMDDAPALLLGLAEGLLEAGLPDRGCDLVRLLGTKEVNRAWAVAKGPLLLDQLCVLPLYRLLAGLKLPADKDASKVRALEVQCLLLLGRKAEAASLAQKLMLLPRCAAADANVAAHALLLVGDVAQREVAVRHSLGQGDGLLPCQRVRLCLEQEASRFPDLWRELLGESPDYRELALAAAEACLLYPDEVLPVLTGYLEGCSPQEKPTLPVYLALRACRRQEDAVLGRHLLSTEWSLAYYRVRSALLRQETGFAACGRSSATPGGVHAAAYAAYTGMALNPAVREPAAPVETMDIRLFGGLEVCIGGRMVDPRLLRSGKVRTLLGILTLNAGKELSRDKLVRSLWPDSSLDSARKNYYAVWSRLRQGLSDGNDGCPYLYHLQGGYKLDGRHVRSDVERLGQLCDSFRYDVVDVSQWQASLQEMLRISEGEIMPGENENQMILSAREEYRVKVVNALVSGAGRLMGEQAPEAALWFAQAAYERERQREDVYYALMSAQVACGQREAALDTFAQDKRFLAESLGIAPSSRMVGLLRRIMEAEEEF